MFMKNRLSRLALAVLGAVIITIASGCGSDRLSAVAETETKITEEQRQVLKRMDETAEQAYQSIQSGDLNATREKIAQLSVLTAKLHYEGITTIEGIQALSTSVTGSMHSLNAVSPDAAQIAKHIAETRLAVDALAHKEQPMWHEFKSPLMEDLELMGEAADQHDAQLANAAMRRWKARVSAIRPAVIISRDSVKATELDSMTSFLEGSARNQDWAALKEAVPALRQALEEIFSSGDRQTSSPLIPTAEPPHPVIWSLVIGAIITCVLAYVAWRKYEAEQGVSRVKKEKDLSQT